MENYNSLKTYFSQGKTITSNVWKYCQPFKFDEKKANDRQNFAILVKLDVVIKLESSKSCNNILIQFYQTKLTKVLWALFFFSLVDKIVCRKCSENCKTCVEFQTCTECRHGLR